jgi:hypothetical protein
MKIVMLAAFKVNGRDGNEGRMPHINLNKYTCIIMNQTIPVRRLIEPLKAICWVMGSPTFG